MAKNEYNKNRHEYHVTSGGLNYSIEVFGDVLAMREGYKKHKGMDAIYFYLVSKYNWLPSVAKALSFDDLHFLLGEEMEGWVLPPDAR